MPTCKSYEPRENSARCKYAMPMIEKETGRHFRFCTKVNKECEKFKKEEKEC